MIEKASARTGAAADAVHDAENRLVTTELQRARKPLLGHLALQEVRRSRAKRLVWRLADFLGALPEAEGRAALAESCHQRLLLLGLSLLLREARVDEAIRSLLPHLEDVTVDLLLREALDELAERHHVALGRALLRRIDKVVANVLRTRRKVRAA